jgi:8-amino-7-oxononanoate synthase
MKSLHFIEEELAQLESLKRRRSLRRLEAGGSRQLRHRGRTLVNFSSNDYLGLSCHPRVKQAAQEAIAQYHAAAGSSRLICGNLAIHEQLEEELACFKGKEAALVFSSGYMTNLGILTALAGEEDQIFSDALNHASIIDGCRLSRARTFVYRHRDTSHLESLLRQAPACRRRLIVRDALFSMDGDVADLPGLVELARRHDCLLILDEAHATGVLGSSGRGIVEHFAEQQGIPAGEDGVDLAMGTLSKALGSFGGFVACSGQMRELLINKARSFIFSTALPPSAVGAARAGLELIQREPSLLEALRKNRRLLAMELSAQGFDLGESQSPILPVIFGQEASALRLSEGLMSKGYFVPAIRPPSVPAGSSRLRITVTAAHSAEEIRALATTIGELARREFESAPSQGRGLVAD